MATRRKKSRTTAAKPKTSAINPYSSPPCFMHEFDIELESTGAYDVQVKRIYDAPDSSDGFRVLVDRLWPRGIRKDRAVFDEWARDLAPSPELRKWFQHDEQKWPEFQKRYRAELRKQASQIEALRQRARQQRVTLLYAAKTPTCNHALVLRDVIRGK